MYHIWHNTTRENDKTQLIFTNKSQEVSTQKGTLIFFSYVGSGPASTIQPQKYQESKHPKIYLKF